MNVRGKCVNAGVLLTNVNRGLVKIAKYLFAGDIYETLGKALYCNAKSKILVFYAVPYVVGIVQKNKLVNNIFKLKTESYRKKYL
jgi:hypothetical protein